MIDHYNCDNKALTSLLGIKSIYLQKENFLNKQKVTESLSLVTFVPLMKAYFIYIFLNIFNTAFDFKLQIFDVFRFGNIKIDQVSVLKPKPGITGNLKEVK